MTANRGESKRKINYADPTEQEDNRSRSNLS